MISDKDQRRCIRCDEPDATRALYLDPEGPAKYWVHADCIASHRLVTSFGVSAKAALEAAQEEIGKPVVDITRRSLLEFPRAGPRLIESGNENNT